MPKKLTPRQREIYKNLMDLCNRPDNANAFFYVDQTTSMYMEVRIFSYNMSNYSSWLLPDAIECRGIMFEMVDGKPVRLISRPMEKFFNYAEVKAWEALGKAPASIGDVVEDVMLKEDGSLISTYLDSDMLFVKSKGSTLSDQAASANFLILSDPAFRARLKEIASDGFTVNMEYVSPANRIVLGYTEPAVVVLNVRDNDTGEYVPYAELFKDPILRKYLVEREAIEVTDLDAFAKETYAKQGIEGYVVKTNKGFVKLKTDWYVQLHRTKDSITKNKDLFVNIAEGNSDDLKQLFLEDIASLQKINDFEDSFIDGLNRLLLLADKSIDELRGKSRKDFAVALSSNRSADSKLIFGPLMTWFVDNDKQKLSEGIVSMMIKNFDQFVPEKYK